MTKLKQTCPKHKNRVLSDIGFCRDCGETVMTPIFPTPAQPPSKFPLCSKYGFTLDNMRWCLGGCEMCKGEQERLELALSKAERESERRGEVIGLRKGEEQGKLSVLNKIDDAFQKQGNEFVNDYGAMYQTGFERLKSQLSERRVLSEVSSQESSKEGAK
jgi:hypothetical protein